MTSDAILPSSDDTDTSRFQTALSMIERLRKEDFNQQTEATLSSHPYLVAAENGSLTTEQQRAFVCQQFKIQKSDAISFAHLAGHSGFLPKSLADKDLIVPTTTTTTGVSYKENPDLFQFLLQGEVFAASLLLDYAQHLGLEGERAILQHAHTHNNQQVVTPLAQAYPSYWARLALSNQRAAGAAACAVNFPAWGRMCQRLVAALQKQQQQHQQKEHLDKALAFIQFFATPIENLDEMAAAIIMQEDEMESMYEEIADHVRILQAYEVYFWDACYKAT